MNGNGRSMVSAAVSVVSACSSQPVSFETDIQPILDNKCSVCHLSPDGIGYRLTGLRLDSYESLMKGSLYGPVVVRGDSRRSILNMLVEGRAGKMRNLPTIRKHAFTEKEIAALRDWVDQGAQNN